MKEELSLREIINEVIIFFINFKTLIIVITFVGTLGVIVFQKIRPAYYNTTSIATSGISAFERIEDEKEVLNQRTAINIINTLHLDVQKEDFIVIAEKLNISSNTVDTHRRNILKKLNISMSEAISMYLSQITLHNGIPFELKIPLLI